MNLALKAAIVGIVLNVLLPFILTPLATPEEVKPQGGAGSLSFKGQFMHMMVHHNQVMVTSSLIIALIVYLSVMLAKSKMLKRL
tara:strand:+ start:66 stop:317 length:252 start_codon:yes stop_codon:yes gene_type:complete